MYCPNCGHENEDASRFCEACGQKLAEEAKPEPQKVFCPECGCEIVDSSAVFCPNCGKNIREPWQGVENAGAQNGDVSQQPPLMEFEPWEEEPRPKKKSNVLLIVLGIVAVVLAAAVAVFGIWYMKLSNEPEHDTVIVSSDSEEERENQDKEEADTENKKEEDVQKKDASDSEKGETESGGDEKDALDSEKGTAESGKNKKDTSDSEKKKTESGKNDEDTSDNKKEKNKDSEEGTTDGTKKEASAPAAAAPAPAVTSTPAPTPTEAPKEHRYELIIEDCTWEEARQRCIERGGYLARIETAEEFDALIQMIEANGMQDKMFMIGARRDEGGSLYYWADDQNQLSGNALNDPSSPLYSRWMSGEPSFGDQGNPECYVDIFYFKDESRWVMNDVMNDIVGAVPSYSGRVGYICEYEE